MISTVHFLIIRSKDFYAMFGDILYTVGFATILAIIVACLGLFGMATYSIQTRLREIGVRKVFGSQSGSVALLIGRTFLIMLAIAALIGCTGRLLAKLNLDKISCLPGLIWCRHYYTGISIIFIIGILTVSVTNP